MRKGSARATLDQSVQVVHGLMDIMRRRCTVEGSKALIRGRLAARDRLFLEVMRGAIWENPRSPFYHLLRWAGWTQDALTVSVRERGLEATLEALRAAGVYLSHAEFKEQQPIQRNGLRLEWTDLTLENPAVKASFEVQTGGTRSLGTRVPASFTYLTDQRAPTWCLTLEALEGGTGPVIIWMPRSAGFLWWLTLLHMRRPAVRWFSSTDLRVLRVPLLHRLMYRLGQIIALGHGYRVPSMEFVPLTEAETVLDAVLRVRARQNTCAVVASPSGAARLAALALQRGTDLKGVVFIVGGEPLTEGKQREILRAGAHVGVRYNMTEVGAIGAACGRPQAVDDVHLMADSFALIPHRRALPNGEVAEAFMLTTLLATSPMVLLNLDTDDFGQISVRRCGCLWDDLGLHTHLSRIESFSKLTGEGVTVLGTECVRILEQVLPREFGGRSTDYQLLEVEGDDHLTRLHLVVSRGVGPIDEEKLVARFQEELHRPVIRTQTIPLLWGQVNTIKVVRQEPVTTASGKLLPFHTLALTRLPRGQGGQRDS